jgi:hypothetical protein
MLAGCNDKSLDVKQISVSFVAAGDFIGDDIHLGTYL